MKDKTIIRHIPAQHFLAWKELYEDYAFWQDRGFTYVPIEPIISYDLGKDGTVAVFAGVLDLSLATWKDMAGPFQGELEIQKNRILSALDEKGFEHGHNHDNNFCLRLVRNAQGQPRFDVLPRLYLIDFDQAVSP